MTQNHGLTPLEKSNMTTWKSNFLQGVFLAYLAVLNIVSYFIYMKNNKKDKCSNFDSKSWINPFGKTQYAHPKMELKQSCQFSLAKPHKEEKNTQ